VRFGSRRSRIATAKKRLSRHFFEVRFWQAACLTSPDMQTDADGARILDHEVLDELRESLGATGAGVIDVAASRFVARSASRLEAAHEAAARGDAAMLGRLAHQLIGGASQLGAERMTSLASELEDMVRHGRLDGAGVLVTRLSDAFVETKAALQALGISVEATGAGIDE
jgi:HPt (histidine-containing phosphotransfer) domain-containing protein